MANPLNYGPWTGSAGPSSSPSDNPSNRPKSAAAAAIVSAIASVIGAGIGAWSQHRTNQSNAQLQREAYSQNLAQWLRENAYNSPLAQRQRLIQAGFNPDLMIQGAGSLGLPSASSPQVEAPEVKSLFNGSPFGNLGSVASSYFDNRLREEQIASIELDNKIKEQKLPQELKNLELAGQKLRTDIASSVSSMLFEALDNARKSEKHAVEMAQANVDYQTAQEQLSHQQVINKEWEDNKDYRKLMQKLEEQLKRAQIASVGKANQLTDIEIKKAKDEIASISLLNDSMADNQILLDYFYPVYLRANIKDDNLKGVKDPSSLEQSAFNSNTLSPDDWLKSMTYGRKMEMLKTGQYGHNKRVYPMGQSYESVKSDSKYQNIYWQKVKEKDTYSPVTRSYFGKSSSQHFGFGVGPVSVSYSE